MRRKVLIGLPLLPITVLFLINFFDQFDTAAFNVLSPEIKKAFHLSTAGISAISAINLLFTTVFVLGIGYLADRSERKQLVVWSGIAAALTSFFTGAAVGLWALVLLRLGNGAGRLVNDPVHTSLLTDYYPADRRPEVFSVHRSAEPFGQIAGPVLAGGLAALWSWRLAFFVLAVPALAIAVYAQRLREPARGESDDRKAAEATEEEPPLPFGRAYRVLYNVRTLRRIWLANFFVGAGTGPLIAVFALYWDKVFHLGSFDRGFITAGGAIFSLIGIAVGGPVTRRLLEQGAARVQLVAGTVVAANAALLLVVAAARPLWIDLGAFFLISAGFGFFVAPSLAVASIVIPARVRSQGFAFGPLYLALGAILSVPLAGIADTNGYRWALFAFSPVLVLAGLVFASAYRFVDSDARRSMRALETEAELRRQRLTTGKGALLVCRGLDVSYGLVPVLHEVDFQIFEGEIVALLGTNGAGKSTLLRTIAGLIHPENGVVYFDATDVTFHEPEETAAAGIVLAPGGQSLFPDMTVAESLLAAGWPLRGETDELRARVDEVVALFPRLRERLNQVAGTMSGGEQQMLALAQALMSRPRLLMIDELTSGLAPAVVHELLDAVRAVAATGVTVVLVEQSANVALSLAERAYFMERGRIRFSGPTQELVERGDLLRAVFLR